MNGQDFFTALDVWVWHGHLTVKTTRAQQGGVQNITAVGCGQDDHTFVRLKTVHLNQQLVQCLFAFIVSTAIACATVTANGVDFVDKDDTRRILFRLFEHVTHTRCTHTHEHFNKVRPRNGKEWHTRLTRNRARKECFTRTRRTNKQSTLWNFTAQAAKFLGVAQEFNDFFQLFFGLINTRHVIECDTTLLFGQKLGLGFAKAHCPTTATALHAVHEINPNPNQQ